MLGVLMDDLDFYDSINESDDCLEFEVVFISKKDNLFIFGQRLFTDLDNIESLELDTLDSIYRIVRAEIIRLGLNTVNDIKLYRF